jgi:hypothetical protein
MYKKTTVIMASAVTAVLTISVLAVVNANQAFAIIAGNYNGYGAHVYQDASGGNANGGNGGSANGGNCNGIACFHASISQQHHIHVQKVG